MIRLAAALALVALFAGRAGAQQDTTPRKPLFEPEPPLEACDFLEREAYGLWWECRQRNDRRAFLMSAKSCMKALKNQTLWSACIQKLDIDLELAGVCSTRVTDQHGLSTKDEGALADKWWQLINDCYRESWAQLLQVQLDVPKTQNDRLSPNR